MNKPFSAVLFDLDGTLIDSLDLIVGCWQHTVRTCVGREMTREEILPTVGRALRECLEEVAQGRSEELMEVYRTYEQAADHSVVRLAPGALETLDALQAAGYRLGVATSKGLVVAVEGLDLFNLAPKFEVVVTYEDSERHKPYPDPLLVAAARLGLAPERVLYVGDALVDIQAGKAAGMGTAGVLWGSAGEGIKAAGPDLVLENMGELVQALGAA